MQVCSVWNKSDKAMLCNLLKKLSKPSWHTDDKGNLGNKKIDAVWGELWMNVPAKKMIKTEIFRKNR